MAETSPNDCATCSIVGNDLISEIEISAEPSLRGKRIYPEAQQGTVQPEKKAKVQSEDIPGTSKNLNNFDDTSKAEFPLNQILERPKYVFSKSQWTHDKDQALEKLLMQ